MVNYLLQLLAIAIAVIFILSAHEFGHAFVAVKCGDDTPKLNGRYTLNPMKHIEPIGFVLLLFAGFGWAKPVPVNPYNFKKPKRDMILVSIAGVIINYVLAFITYPLFLLSLKIPDIMLFDDFIVMLFYFGFALNLSLFVFNLFPIYPLDGFRVIEATTKPHNKFVQFMYKNGSYILMCLLILGFIAEFLNVPQLDILGMLMNFCVNIIGWPIIKFWGLF